MHRLLVLAIASAIGLAAPRARADDLTAASRKVADGLAGALSLSPDKDAIHRVVVLPFTEGFRIARGQGAAAAAATADRLAELGGLQVLTPEAMKAMVGEQRLQVMLGSLQAGDPDLVDRAQAQAVITGALAADGERVRVTVKLVIVPSGRPVGSSQAYADGASLTPAPGGESGRIEVAMRRVADGLARGFARLPGNARYKRLAVFPFSEVGERTQKARLGTIVAAEIATNLRRDHALLLVEREKIGQVLGELKLREMLSPDRAQASRAGNLADAEGLVIGSVAEVGDRYLVTARIVATETGETLAAESASVSATGMISLASDAVVLRSRSDALLRSVIFPGMGQLYNRQPAKGYGFAAAEVALLAGAAGFHLSGNAERRKYHGARTASDAAYYYTRASSRYQTRNWLLVGAGVVWAVNVVDAWASGVDGEKLLQGEQVVAAPVVLPGGGGLAVAGRF
jgi:TolB-like protein